MCHNTTHITREMRPSAARSPKRGSHVSRKKRTPIEQISDRLLLLYLLSELQPCSNLGDTKLQKLVFLSERDMIREHVKGFDFYFFKFLHGPFSRQLENDLSDLDDWGLYLPDEHMLTSHGRKVAEWLGDLWHKNREVTRHIDETLHTYGDLSRREILPIVYSLQHPFYEPPRRIADLNYHSPILFKVQDEQARRKFEISAAELETLEILLDVDQYHHLIYPKEDEENESVPYPGV